MSADTLHKPGYEGPKPSTSLSGPERQVLRLGRPELVRRLHDAMLCLSVQKAPIDLGVRSGSPAYLHDFADKVSQELEEPRKPRFRPTAAQIDAMDADLLLLEGLTRHHFKVVFLRALDDFNGEWPWAKIGAAFERSDRWAETTYDSAIVQAARRAGVLPMFTHDYAILVAGLQIALINPRDRGWRTCVLASADPRQEASNLKSKNPMPLEVATIIWTSGKAKARQIIGEARSNFGAAPTHGSWFRAAPEVIVDQLVLKARDIGAPWFLEDVDLKGRG